MLEHTKKAGVFLKNTKRANWHDQTLWQVRKKRDAAAGSIKEWEKLREQASIIKENVLSNLDNYLIEFEGTALRNGVQVHWAEDADALTGLFSIS